MLILLITDFSIFPRFSGALCGLAYIFALPCLIHMLSLHRRGRLTWFQLLIHSILTHVYSYITQVFWSSLWPGVHLCPAVPDPHVVTTPSRTPHMVPAHHTQSTHKHRSRKLCRSVCHYRKNLKLEKGLKYMCQNVSQMFYKDDVLCTSKIRM